MNLPLSFFFEHKTLVSQCHAVLVSYGIYCSQYLGQSFPVRRPDYKCFLREEVSQWLTLVGKAQTIHLNSLLYYPPMIKYILN